MSDSTSGTTARLEALLKAAKVGLLTTDEKNELRRLLNLTGDIS